MALSVKDKFMYSNQRVNELVLVRSRPAAANTYTRTIHPLNERGGICNGKSNLAGCGDRIIGTEEGNVSIGDTHNGAWLHGGCAKSQGLSVGDLVTYDASTGIWALKPLDPAAELPPIKHLSKSHPRSQKAQGLKLIQNGFAATCLVQEDADLAWVPTLLAAVAHVATQLEHPVRLKARPCPVRPRHGFVESRDVLDEADILNVWNETKRADPEAEMLLMVSVDAGWSAILTPNALTYGESNDGATSGRGARTFKLGTGRFWKPLNGAKGPIRRAMGLPEALLTAAWIDKDHAPYMEYVWEKDFEETPILVQLRAGPKVKAIHDYVPRKMKVKHVHRLEFTLTDEDILEEYDLEPSRPDCECELNEDGDGCSCEDTPETCPAVGSIPQEDLIAWERLVPTFPKGTVVYHPGGALRSHFGVHCMINKVPYLTTYEPSVGDTIRPECTDTHVDVESVLHGMRFAINVPPSDDYGSKNYNAEASAALFFLHNLPSEHGPLGSWLLGRSAARLYRLLAMACIGEFRHYQSTHGGTLMTSETYEKMMIKYGCTTPEDLEEKYGFEPLPPWMDWHFTLHDHEVGGTFARYQVLDTTWTYDHKDLLPLLTCATRSFLEHNWSGGMGGLNWGRCGLSALRLYDAMLMFDHIPTEDNLARLIEAMNSTVNMVHNGGTVFNKFVTPSEKTQACMLGREVLLGKAFPFMLAAESDRYQHVEPLDQEPGLWHEMVGYELQAYADHPHSVKRCEYQSGNPYEQHAVKLGCWIQKCWAMYARKCAHAVGYALYRSWANVPQMEYETQITGLYKTTQLVDKISFDIEAPAF
jgi:hypothetical protein